MGTFYIYLIVYTVCVRACVRASSCQAKESGLTTLAQILVPQSVFADAMASLTAAQPVNVRVSHSGSIYQADVRMEGTDIVCSQTDVADLVSGLLSRMHMHAVHGRYTIVIITVIIRAF